MVEVAQNAFMGMKNISPLSTASIATFAEQLSSGFPITKVKYFYFYFYSLVDVLEQLVEV